MVALKIGNIELVADYITKDCTEFYGDGVPKNKYNTYLSVVTNVIGRKICYGSVGLDSGPQIDYVEEIRKLSNLVAAARQIS